MKKLMAILVTALLSVSIFAQTTVAEKKLEKTLEKNKDPAAVFVSEIDLSKMQVAESGDVTIPLFVKNKIKIVFGMDMTSISERIAFANKTLATTFEVKDISSKTYAITNIAGIETLAQYRERCVEEQRVEARKKLLELPVQIIGCDLKNITGIEAMWVPLMIQDKFYSNLQTYLKMKTIIDSNSDGVLKKINSERKNIITVKSNDLEFEKNNSTRFALFSRICKSGNTYNVYCEFVDLKTGELMATSVSKEYSKTECLLLAVNEITVDLARNLGIEIHEEARKILLSDINNLTIDEQIIFVEQNSEKLLEEIKAQKLCIEADLKLDEQRSDIFKTQRDQIAKKAIEKASNIRKKESQNILGQISVIESKKKAISQIRQGVEARTVELHEQMEENILTDTARILNRPYGSVELSSDGTPTGQAIQRRKNQVAKNKDDLTNKFFTDAEAVKQSTMAEQNNLFSEIKAGQKVLAATKTLSSLGDELKINFGTYEGSKNGWNTYLYLFSDGELLYIDNFILNYEAVTGKKAPDMTVELNDTIIEEYTNNVDLYNSLLCRGNPVIYFEIDYNIIAESDDKPSQYKLNFNRFCVVNTISGKEILADNKLNGLLSIKPAMDLREYAGIVESTKAQFNPEKYAVEVYMTRKGVDLIAAKKAIVRHEEESKIFNQLGIVDIPDAAFKILKTEVTQKLYKSIMGDNPSEFKGDNNPVENVSWFDAVYFCNKLSEKYGFTPVYSVNGSVDVSKWNYTPHYGKSIEGNVTQNKAANGFRLPEDFEWLLAASGGQNYKYSGSDDYEDVAWLSFNMWRRLKNTYPVAQKKANGYGLYDMSGNVEEWVWSCNVRGGCYESESTDVQFYFNSSPYYRGKRRGFRIVCSSFD